MAISKKKKLSLTVLIERDEDGYFVARVPALRSCYTQAKTMDELRRRLREVIKLCAKKEPLLMKIKKSIDQP